MVARLIGVFGGMAWRYGAHRVRTATAPTVVGTPALQNGVRVAKGVLACIIHVIGRRTSESGVRGSGKRHGTSMGEQ